MEKGVRTEGIQAIDELQNYRLHKHVGGFAAAAARQAELLAQETQVSQPDEIDAYEPLEREA